MADAVPEIARIGIRRIVSRCKVHTREKCLNFLTSETRKRSDESVLPDRKDTFESSDTAAPDEVHQNGFGDVVLMVPECDFGSTDAFGDIFIKPIPRCASCRFRWNW